MGRESGDGVGGVPSNLTDGYVTREYVDTVAFDRADGVRFATVTRTEHEFPVGGIEEYQGICIEVDHIVDIYSEFLDRGCPHVRGGVVPFVIHMDAEAGHLRTTACVQCIMDAMERLKRDGGVG